MKRLKMNLNAVNSELFSSILNRPDKYPVSSLEIAELCDKRHADVLASVRNLDKEIENTSKSFGYEVDSYLDGSGRKVLFYKLSKLTALTLLAGYEAKMRLSIIDFLLNGGAR